MNIIVKQEDTIETLINKRISYFKDLRLRYSKGEIKSICDVKISTLEMILKDIKSLRSVKNRL